MHDLLIQVAVRALITLSITQKDFNALGFQEKLMTSVSMGDAVKFLGEVTLGRF